jgi:hypothetical protein
LPCARCLGKGPLPVHHTDGEGDRLAPGVEESFPQYGVLLMFILVLNASESPHVTFY